MPLPRAAGPDDCTTPMPAARTSRFLTPARTGMAALAVAAVTAGTALTLATVPAVPALGAADALAVPAVAAAPVTYADTGSPALDKARRTAAASLAVAKADALAVHQAHLSHAAHLAVLARKARLAALARLAAQRAAQAKAAAAARQLLIEQAAAKKAHSVAPVAHHQPAGSSGGSTGGSGTVTATSAFQACVIQRESGGNSQVMNSSGHYGLYQFSYSTWVAAGGAGSLFGHASAAYQTQVFWKAYALWGVSPWRPYDGC